MADEYKLEQQRSELGTNQWVVLPESKQEHARPATACEVSLWQAWQQEKRVNEQFLDCNRLRFKQRTRERGIER